MVGTKTLDVGANRIGRMFWIAGRRNLNILANVFDKPLDMGEELFQSTGVIYF